MRISVISQYFWPEDFQANDIMPGLTGWAQINGRDELPIEVKALLDGEYIQRMSFGMDVKCFFGTIISVLKRDGVVEGGTGTLDHKEVAATKESVLTGKSVVQGEGMLLVTGITGHSGRYFLQELIDDKYGDTIRCVVRTSSDTSMLDGCGLKIEKVVGDLEDQKLMDEAMVSVDTVMHIAGIHRTLNVIQAAVRNDVKRAFVVHTTGIYSKYKSASEDYRNTETKMRVLIEVSGSSIGVIILRPTMIYGNINDLNMSKFIKLIDKFKLFPVINHGGGLIQPVNARDLGKAYYQILVTPNITSDDYILSGEAPITMLDTFKLISRSLSRETIFISFPLALGVLIARILKATTLSRVDYIEKVQRMDEDRSFPHDNATRDFGYNPMPFEDGLRMEVEQYLTKK